MIDHALLRDREARILGDDIDEVPLCLELHFCTSRRHSGNTCSMTSTAISAYIGILFPVLTLPRYAAYSLPALPR